MVIKKYKDKTEKARKRRSTVPVEGIRQKLKQFPIVDGQRERETERTDVHKQQRERLKTSR